MKIKLDENFGLTIKKLFVDSGFDVHTVYDEGLRRIADIDLYRTAIMEKRCLITMDKDFSDVLRFNPQSSYGIVIIRSPNKASIEMISQTITSFIKYCEKESPENCLWIVEPDRIRIHQKD